MNNKLCRICWNTNGWRRPSGDAVNLESGSFVSKYGFGHEEWLFNYEWLIDGYMYSFLQPINKYRNSYAGKMLDILLYTLPPGFPTMLVAVLRDVEVLSDIHVADVTNIFKENRWLYQMQDDVKTIGGSVDRLGYPTSDDITNIRFRPNKVELFDPMLEVKTSDSFRNLKRYHPYNWDSDYLKYLNNNGTPSLINGKIELPDPQRAEHARLRAAQKGTSYYPQHIRLQNRLYKYLCSKYGKNAVKYEQDFVDISVTTENHVMLFEVKLEPTAKRCVRLALGQLLEYAHYPNKNGAVELIVVGDAMPTTSDIEYLNHLRTQYALPLKYSVFDWESSQLKQEI